MRHRVLLTDREQRLLVGLIGRPLYEVRSDCGFSGELHVGNGVIEAMPEPFHAPIETDPRGEEVIRPSFAVAEHAWDRRRPLA